MGIEELLLDRAKNEGIEKGTKTGIKTGIQTGIELERAKAERERKEIAKNFKKLGVAIDDISKGTGLTIKEVESL